jgi:hypothetical protein
MAKVDATWDWASEGLTGPSSGPAVLTDDEDNAPTEARRSEPLRTPGAAALALATRGEPGDIELGVAAGSSRFIDITRIGKPCAPQRSASRNNCSLGCLLAPLALERTPVDPQPVAQHVVRPFRMSARESSWMWACRALGQCPVSKLLMRG